jgi:hypothetical protein
MLPEVSLGLWQNFGDTKPLEDQRAILRRAFETGIRTEAARLADGTVKIEISSV